MSPVADRIAALLDLPEAGMAAAARKLAGELPGMMPADPRMAAVLEEEIATAFAGAAADPEEPTQNANPNKTPDGKFASDGGDRTGGGGQESPKTKAKREIAQAKKENEANGVRNMAIVESGRDCPEFMRSRKLGNIAFYQGNEKEGYLHIKNNPDPGHQAMLRDNNIPKTLAYGKYYEDVYKNKVGITVMLGDKCVHLSEDGDGVKITTAYISKNKAVVFRTRTAFENSEVVLP